MYEAKVTLRLESEPLASAGADADAFARNYLVGVGSDKSDPKLASFDVEGKSVEATISLTADSVGSAAARALMVATHVVARVVGANTVTAITVDVSPNGEVERPARKSGKYDGRVIAASGLSYDGEFHVVVMTEEDDFVFVVDSAPSARELLGAVSRLRPWIDLHERAAKIERIPPPRTDG